MCEGKEAVFLSVPRSGYLGDDPPPEGEEVRSKKLVLEIGEHARDHGEERRTLGIGLGKAPQRVECAVCIIRISSLQKMRRVDRLRRVCTINRLFGARVQRMGKWRGSAITRPNPEGEAWSWQRSRIWKQCRASVVEKPGRGGLSPGWFGFTSAG